MELKKSAWNLGGFIFFIYRKGAEPAYRRQDAKKLWSTLFRRPGQVSRI